DPADPRASLRRAPGAVLSAHPRTRRAYPPVDPGGHLGGTGPARPARSPGGDRAQAGGRAPAQLRGVLAAGSPAVGGGRRPALLARRSLPVPAPLLARPDVGQRRMAAVAGAGQARLRRGRRRAGAAHHEGGPGVRPARVLRPVLGPGHGRARVLMVVVGSGARRPGPRRGLEPRGRWRASRVMTWCPVADTGSGMRSGRGYARRDRNPTRTQRGAKNPVAVTSSSTSKSRKSEASLS